MRPSFRLRGFRAVHVIIALTALAAPASALALSGSRTPRPQPSLPVRVSPRHVALGQPVLVAGRTAATAAGDVVALQTALGGHGRWTRVATTRIGRHGGWAIHARLRASGRVRAVETTSPAVVSAERSASGASRVATRAAAVRDSRVRVVSRTTPVQVRARLQVAARAHDAVLGRDAAVSGHLLPARSGRVVAVQARRGSGWRTVGRARTGRRGGFSVRFAAPAGAGRRLRAVFAGDRLNAGSARGAGSLTLFTPTVVSWYDDAGSTACGFHAVDGVANRTLPCGTKVLFRDGGRSVTAIVDDRGPYVTGRDFDLSQTTAGALGFAGVGTIEASVQ